MGKNRTIGIQEAMGTAIYTDSGRLAIKLTFSIIFAVLMAVSANSFFYLPFTPVPVTMQVMTVILSAIMLGHFYYFPGRERDTLYVLWRHGCQVPILAEDTLEIVQPAVPKHNI